MRVIRRRVPHYQCDGHKDGRRCQRCATESVYQDIEGQMVMFGAYCSDHIATGTLEAENEEVTEDA